MEDTTVRPALTPEEWEAEKRPQYWRADRPCIRTEYDGLRVELDDVSTGEPELFGSVLVPAEDRHALAALALHGQPFGFTRKDVALLRSIAHNRGLGAAIGGPQPDEQLRDLAARIAALLPPE